MTNYPTLTIIINQHAASGHSKNILRRVIKYLKRNTLSTISAVLPKMALKN